MSRIVVFGSRDFTDYSLLEIKLNYYLQGIKDEIIIVSGTARGADSLGILYAKNYGYPVEKYPAHWEEYGKKAGMMLPILYYRNRLMARHSDYAVGFWDGKSRGTKGMIDICRELNVPLRVVRYQ